MSTSGDSQSGTASTAPAPASDLAFQRARSPEQKEQRRHDILAAARKLGTRDGVRAVTLTDIAAEAGVHKSAVLRYFETREAVFLLLTAEHWQDWAKALEQALPEPARPEQVAAVLAGTLSDRPLFCDLLAHAPLNLERGVSLAAVRSFKMTAIAEAEAVSAALCLALPLTLDQAGNVVATATAMAGALWQMAAPGTELRRFYEDTPELAHAVIEVGPRLSSILTALLRGYRTPSG